MWATFFARTPILVVADAVIAREICIKHFGNFVNHNSAAFPLNRLQAKFISMVRDAEWRSMRNVMTPTFSGGKMRAVEYCFWSAFW